MLFVARVASEFAFFPDASAVVAFPIVEVTMADIAGKLVSAGRLPTSEARSFRFYEYS